MHLWSVGPVSSFPRHQEDLSSLVCAKGVPSWVCASLLEDPLGVMVCGSGVSLCRGVESTVCVKGADRG